MAKNPKFSNLCVNTKADEMLPLLDHGYLRIYSGTQPTTADDAVGGGTLLAELRWGVPAFGAAVAGVAVANAITQDSSANASGTAAWFRALTAYDDTVFDGSVGAGGTFDLVLNTTSIVAGAAVQVNTFTYTENKG